MEVDAKDTVEDDDINLEILMREYLLNVLTSGEYYIDKSSIPAISAKVITNFEAIVLEVMRLVAVVIDYVEKSVIDYNDVMYAWNIFITRPCLTISAVGYGDYNEKYVDHYSDTDSEYLPSEQMDEEEEKEEYEEEEYEEEEYEEEYNEEEVNQDYFDEIGSTQSEENVPAQSTPSWLLSLSHTQLDVADDDEDDEDDENIIDLTQLPKMKLLARILHQELSCFTRVYYIQRDALEVLEDLVENSIHLSMANSLNSAFVKAGFPLFDDIIYKKNTKTVSPEFEIATVDLLKTEQQQSQQLIDTLQDLIHTIQPTVDDISYYHDASTYSSMLESDPSPQVLKKTIAILTQQLLEKEMLLGSTLYDKNILLEENDMLKKSFQSIRQTMNRIDFGDQQTTKTSPIISPVDVLEEKKILRDSLLRRPSQKRPQETVVETSDSSHITTSNKMRTTSTSSMTTAAAAATSSSSSTKKIRISSSTSSP